MGSTPSDACTLARIKALRVKPGIYSWVRFKLLSNLAIWILPINSVNNRVLQDHASIRSFVA